VLSSFLSRSFRRSLHSHHELQLVKALAASENLAVAEASWSALRESGAMVEEEGEEEEKDESQENLDEKVVSALDGSEEAEGLGLSISLDEKSNLRNHVHDMDVQGYDVGGDDLR
jgi:vacuolar protein sorting-associated protein 3